MKRDRTARPQCHMRLPINWLAQVTSCNTPRMPCMFLVRYANPCLQSIPVEHTRAKQRGRYISRDGKLAPTMGATDVHYPRATARYPMSLRYTIPSKWIWFTTR